MQSAFQACCLSAKTRIMEEESMTKKAEKKEVKKAPKQKSLFVLLKNEYLQEMGLFYGTRLIRHDPRHGQQHIFNKSYR